jgi:osmotically-inducible protein OsmY
MKKLIVSAAVIGMIAVTGPAGAQETGGVKIGGDVDMKTKAENAINASVGQDTLAKQQIGGVQGDVTIKGDLKQETEVGTAVNAAIGQRARACQNIGGISSDATCE